MPPRGARPSGDRDALLDGLSPLQRLALEEAIRDLDLGENWHRAPAIARFVELVAFVRAAERLRIEEGATRECARDLSAIRLGLNPESLDRELRRQRNRSDGGPDKMPGVNATRAC